MMSIITNPQSNVMPTMLCGSWVDSRVAFLCVDDESDVAVSGSIIKETMIKYLQVMDPCFYRLP